MTREKTQAIVCLDSAISGLWDAYKDLREAHDYFPDDELLALASRALGDMVAVLEVERKVNKSDEI